MYVIRLAHPCGTVVVLRTGIRRIAGELVTDGTYHDPATGDLTIHCPGCGEWLGKPLRGRQGHTAALAPHRGPVQPVTRTVYLLHFEHRHHHAGHYLGSTDNLQRRLAQHRAGRGARLIEVITAAGIGFELARTWEGDRTLERRLKRRKEGPRLCPICRSAAPTASIPTG